MGSCISKCKPKMMMKRPPLLDFNFNNVVQDKLVVIPQPQPLLLTTAIPSLSLNNKISPYPPSPSPSTSSISSFTCLSSTPTNSSFSTSSSSRSPTFSDDYLWSCYHQNPHVVRINSLKANAFSSSPSPSPMKKPLSPAVQQWQRRHPSPQRVSRSTPQKRVRPASPSPVRQKSFRKVERPPSPLSPSRRLGGEKFRVAPVKAASPKRQLPAARGCGMMKKEITCIHRISSKIDEVAAREAVLNDGDLDTVVAMEDIDNPLISLDCFIFL